MPIDPIRMSQAGPAVRRRIRVGGIVQGVGFRPFVFRLATELDLAGWVLNDASGVSIEIEGAREAVEAFEERLMGEAPPLSSIEACEAAEIEPTGAEHFEIRASERGAHPTTRVSPDTATCPDCLRELADPADRRYRYPFINCTNCGPRFTIIRGIPYDRPCTTMAGFEMCELCRAEYEDPLNRRFHAQPNACPACGPSVRWINATGEPIAPTRGADAADPVARAAAAIRAGAIVAVKGLGGYHLACTAADEGAVRRLRSRKHREDKPFAVMVPDVEAARRLVALDGAEEDLLASRARPIVLARRLDGAPVAAAVAPGHRDLGVMLPYTPLHHLLLADAGVPLVMTSGNVSDEPIAFRDEDALERLAPIADSFLVHDRPIHVRTDDSVVRVVDVAGERRPLMLRRSRGWVPEPLPLPGPPSEPLVACGAHLKNTFTVAAAGQAWVGHHIGDLENYETLRSFEEGIAHFERLFEVRPAALVHDLHPDYLSTKYVRRRAEAEELATEGVQHHHAHLAACLAEHGEPGPALGVIYDGTGLGTDGTVWGGELLAGDASAFERAAHLWPVRLPGGEAAIRQPWRMACAWLCALADADQAGDPEPPPWWNGAVDEERWRAVVQLVRSGVASPVTTSAGRLFDAVSALCGVRLETTYEGQAAIELEMAASAAEEETAGYPLPLLRPHGQPAILDARQTVRAALADLGAGLDPARVARRFHAGVADGTAAVCAAEAKRLDISTVVLSGGVLQNVLLLERLAGRLSGLGLRPLVPRRLPPNDGGISYGQAAVRAARNGAPETAEKT